MRRAFLALAAGTTALASVLWGMSPAGAVTIYTATGATTAQAPLLGAIRDGWGGSDAGPIEIRAWKDLDDLRGTILAGKGDLWVGHLDGLAQAARQGAPITLIALTAWADKFRFLTVDPDVHDPAGLVSLAATRGEPLVVVPRGSPAVALIQAASGRAAPRLSDRAPQQAALDIGRGTVRHVLAPEPLATALAGKFPGLRDVGGLSALAPPATEQGDGTAEAPMAGVAVRTALLTERPELIHALVTAMIRWADAHRNDPDGVVAVLPAETLAALGPDTVRQSLSREPLRVVDAAAARPLIAATLRLLDGPHPLADGFLPP